MTLQARIWASAASLVLLAVVGEFVGSARRGVLRREISDFTAPDRKPGQVRLRVKGADGLPVPQASAAQILYRGTGDSKEGTRQFYGLNSGFVVLGAPGDGPGTRWVEVWGPADTADDPLPFGGVLVGPVPEGTEDLEVVLPPERSIAGSIGDAGAPLRGIKVMARRAYPEEFDFLAGTGSETWQAVSTTDAEGRFLLGRLGEGPQEVAFETRFGLAFAMRRVESGSTLDVDVAAGPAAAVTVVDEGGRPLGNAGISVFPHSGPKGAAGVRALAKGTTDGKGQVRIQGLASEAKYRLIVTRPGASSGDPGLESEWTPSPVTITVQPLRTIRVRVVDDRGNPHEGVTATARSGGTGATVTAATGPDGRCNLKGVESGAATITIQDPCAFRPAETLQKRPIDYSGREELFTVVRGPEISIRLGALAPLRPVAACLREEGGDGAAGGAFRFGRISWHALDPAKTYGAILIDRGGGLAARVEGLRPDDPTRVVTLSPALDLTVSVQWPVGAADRVVYAAWGSRAFANAEELPDGSRVIHCLPAGKFTVFARCRVPGRKEQAQSFVEAEAGGAASIQVR